MLDLFARVVRTACFSAILFVLPAWGDVPPGKCLPGEKPLVVASRDEVDVTVPITQASETEIRNLYCVQLPNLEVGDVLYISGNAEIRNDANYNVEFVAFFTLGASIAGPHDYAAPDGVLLDPLNGTDINPQMHYYQPNKSQPYVVQTAMAAPRLCMRIRCRSTAATGGEFATIMHGYGELSVMIF